MRDANKDNSDSNREPLQDPGQIRTFGGRLVNRPTYDFLFLMFVLYLFTLLFALYNFSWYTNNVREPLKSTGLGEWLDQFLPISVDVWVMYLPVLAISVLITKPVTYGIIRLVPPRRQRGGILEEHTENELRTIQCLACEHPREPGINSTVCPECGEPYEPQSKSTTPPGN